MIYTKAALSKNFISHRRAMLKSWMDKAFTLRELGSLMIPAQIWPRDPALAAKYNNFLHTESEKEIRAYMDTNFPGTLDAIQGPDRLQHVYQIFLQDEYHAKSFLKKDSVIIDAGANIGVFSVLAAILSPQGKIYSFEPVKGTHEMLKKNVMKYPNVKTFNAGLGAVAEKKTIMTASRNPGLNAVSDSTLAEKNKQFFDGSETITITTIDEFVRNEKVSKVDVIKIDTEGYEYQILQGAKETIKRDHPIVTMSAYHNEEDRVKLPSYLKSINSAYVCEQRHSAEEDMVCSVKA